MTAGFDDKADSAAIHLIVNADDYGYYPCVSRGIAAAARAGAISATGVLANSPSLDSQIPSLGECPNLDIGVHLNLTSRLPLTPAMAAKLPDGQFPSVFAMAGRIMVGSIDVATVYGEWRAQIEAVLHYGLPLRFLNSHEHIHMLPRLFPVALALAKEYGMAQVRETRPEWLPPWGFSAVLRNGLLSAMAVANHPQSQADAPVFIGLAGSGKLRLEYLQNLFARLKPGTTYELMCHPGLFDSAEINDTRLLAYHDWESELALLTSPSLRELYAAHGIALLNYRGLPVNPS
ncbi:MAG: carbohydrate deacetylase [Candidatus Methylumidiphilus sp.]